MSAESGVSGISSVSGVGDVGGMEHYTAGTSTCTLHNSLLITYMNSRN